ncbi:MAG: glycoside hydrolase family 30 beta sandwich domain-containing protein [Marmoricola sp.]
MPPRPRGAFVALLSFTLSVVTGASTAYAANGRGHTEAGTGAYQAMHYLQPKRDTPTATASMTSAAKITRTTSAGSGLAGWLTTKDARRRVSRLSAAELVPSTSRSAVHVAVDDTQRFQTMDGYGAALTESSAHLLMRLPAAKRTAALRSLFDPVDGAGLSLVRLPLGASEFALSRYTYDDLPSGQTDPSLTRFSLAHDDAEIIPVLREALAINPRLRVMGTPWSAPGWMKTSGSLIGGTLRSDSVDVYARYLVKTVQALRSRRVPIRFLMLGNEPRYAPPDYPGMLMSPAQEAALASTLHRRLVEAGITHLQLIGYDHNWDDTSYPTTLLADPAAGALAGTAFHCYGGQPSAQSVVHDAAPSKGIWFTECTGGDWTTSYAGNLGWNADMLLLGATRNWARSVVLWNLALSPTAGPHKGGCSTCRGVLTVDPATGTVTRNVEYDLLAQGGKAVRPGAVRVATPESVYGVKTVAYLNSDGTHVLTAYNSWVSDQVLVVDQAGRSVGAPLPAGSVVTLRW